MVNSHRHDYTHSYNKFHLHSRDWRVNSRQNIRGSFLEGFCLAVYCIHVSRYCMVYRNKYTVSSLLSLRPIKMTKFRSVRRQHASKEAKFSHLTFYGGFKNTKFSSQAQYFNLFVPIFLLWKDQLKLLVPIFWIEKDQSWLSDLKPQRRLDINSHSDSPGRPHPLGWKAHYSSNKNFYDPTWAKQYAMRGAERRE